MLLALLLQPALASEQVVPYRTNEPIHVDGVLDEPAWQQAPVIKGFSRYSPDTGTPDPLPKARIIYDDQAIYVAFEVRANGKAPLKKDLVSRDKTNMQDFVGVMLDTFGDGQRAYAFRVTPAGVQADGIYVEGDHIWMHGLSYDTVFESAGQSTDEDYVVELAIPFRSLSYRNLPKQSWGLVLTHFTPRPWGINAWPPLTRDVSGALQQAATLGPIHPPEPKLNLEVQPTLVGGTSLESETGQTSQTLSPGLSARLGLTSALTASLAVNPDFSQIEADPDKVTANVKYPLFYEEKRPFFLEGADLLETPIQALYSRSIADPSVGYKLTGRGGGWAFGGMGALDEAPGPSTISMDYATGEELPGWDEDTVDSRRALIHVARLRRELEGGSSVGVLATDKELIGEDSTLANRVGAVDAAAQIGEQVRVYAQGLYSQTDLEDGQSLEGPAWSLQVNRSAQKMKVELSHFGVSSGFRAENGYLQNVGRTGGDLKVNLHLSDVGPMRYLGPGARTQATFDMSGNLVSAYAGPSLEGMPGDATYFQTGGGYQREVYQGREFDLWKFRGHASVRPISDTGLELGWRIGTQPHYDAEDLADLYRGFSWRGSLALNQNLLDRLDLEYRIITERFSREPTSPTIYNTTLHRFRTNLNFTRELSARWITDYNNAEETVSSSALLAWQQNYGTAAYLGGSGVWSVGEPQPGEVSIFAKLSWLWRP